MLDKMIYFSLIENFIDKPADLLECSIDFLVAADLHLNAYKVPGWSSLLDA